MLKAQVNGHSAFRDQRNDTVKIRHQFSEAYRLNFIYLMLTPILIPKKKKRKKDSVLYIKGRKTFPNVSISLLKYMSCRHIMLCGIFSAVLVFLCIRKCTVNRLNTGSAVSRCQSGKHLISCMFSNALFALTKIYICSMNDVSKQERDRMRI